VSFVENHIVPRFTLEDMGISAGQCVRRDANIEMMFVVPAMSKFFPPFRGSVVAERPETWQKLLKLHFPIQKYAGRNNLSKASQAGSYMLRNEGITHDQVGSPDTSIASKMSQESDCLNGFPRTHI